MNAKKMLVVYLSSTNAVLGVATRQAAGAPPVGDLVGAALPVRAPDMESGVAISADDLSVKEVDYSDDAVRKPLSHSLDASGAVVFVMPTFTVACTSNKVTITLSTAVPDGKSAIVVIDAGANHEPLKFTVKTLAGSSIDVSVAGVPPGSHDVFVSVDGYVSLVSTGSF